MALPESPYVDEAGRPRLRTSIVAFLDILGFSQMVVASASQNDSQRVLDMIVAAVQDSREFVRRTFDESAQERERSHGWSVKFFSDNLALGYPLPETEDALPAAAAFVVRAAQRYQLGMALNGFFVRGAMTVGPVCMTEEIIFGSSLIECYQYESKASIVPRVILADPLWQALVHTRRRADRQSICRDIDGWWFVNYLESACDDGGVNWDYIERHKRSILNSLSGTTRHDVLPKYGWACRYHNVFCHWRREDPGYDPRYRIDRADEESTILRMDDLPDPNAV